MSIRAVAFDLGNTLVEYYHMRDFPSILDEVIACSYNALPASPTVTPWEARRAADDESAEQSNW